MKKLEKVTYFDNFPLMSKDTAMLVQFLNETREAINALIEREEKEEEWWEKLFHESFVWEECCDHFALFRVCNEDDNLPLEVKNSRTLCRPEYVKAFIREVVKKTKAEAEQRVLEIKEKLK